MDVQPQQCWMALTTYDPQGPGRGLTLNKLLYAASLRRGASVQTPQPDNHQEPGR